MTVHAGHAAGDGETLVFWVAGLPENDDPFDGGHGRTGHAAGDATREQVQTLLDEPVLGLFEGRLGAH